MKTKLHPITKLGALTAAGILGTGVASAATTYTKGGMDSSYSQQQTGFAGDGLPMLAPGVQELGLGGHLNWEDATAYSFNISYGRFLTSNFLLGGEAGISGINSDKDYRVGLFAEYNFLTGTQWVPFVRGSAGYANPHRGGSSGTVGLDAGIKYFMRSNLAIFASIGGDWVISGGGSSDGIAKQVDLGLRFYF